MTPKDKQTILKIARRYPNTSISKQLKQLVRIATIPKNVIGLRKVLVMHDPETGVLTELWGETFKKVIKKYKGQDLDLYIHVFFETPTGVVFGDDILIGNILDGLTERDYYKAYDKINL